MAISVKYVKVEKVEEEKKEGFETVQVQDSFIYKGRLVELPDQPVHMGNRQLAKGDVIIFAKYSPDTHEIGHYKFVAVADILEVL